MSLLAELQRRNVVRVAIAYAAGAWLLIQIAETLLPVYGFGDAAIRIVVAILAIGLVPALVFSWVFELTDCTSLKHNTDESFNIVKPDRNQTTKRIDGITALVLAANRLAMREGTISIYESRGVISG